MDGNPVPFLQPMVEAFRLVHTRYTYPHCHEIWRVPIRCQVLNATKVVA